MAYKKGVSTTYINNISKYLRVYQKWPAIGSILNSLLGVWTCCQTQSFVINMLHQCNLCITTSYKPCKWKIAVECGRCQEWNECDKIPSFGTQGYYHLKRLRMLIVICHFLLVSKEVEVPLLTAGTMPRLASFQGCNSNFTTSIPDVFTLELPPQLLGPMMSKQRLLSMVVWQCWKWDLYSNISELW